MTLFWAAVTVLVVCGGAVGVRGLVVGEGLLGLGELLLGLGDLLGRRAGGGVDDIRTLRNPMDPPTWTVDCKVVRTTAAVAPEAPLLPKTGCSLLLPLADAAATPPATAPPTRAPAMAAMSTTRRTFISATAAPAAEPVAAAAAAWPSAAADDGAGAAVAARPAFRAGAALDLDGPCRRAPGLPNAGTPVFLEHVLEAF